MRSATVVVSLWLLQGLLMASITFKNVPDDLLESLRLRAERNRRSLTKEVLYLLEQGVLLSDGGFGMRASESTPVVGNGLDPQGRGPQWEQERERERERQVEVWRDLCGQWESEESVAEELEALGAARTGGREVDL